MESDEYHLFSYICPYIRESTVSKLLLLKSTPLTVIVRRGGYITRGQVPILFLIFGRRRGKGENIYDIRSISYIPPFSVPL